MYELSSSSRKRLEGVDPQLVTLIEESLKVCPIDFGIPQYGGVRTDEEQYELYLAGKSKCDGYKIRGNHQKAEDGLGKAIDVYAYVNGRASWDAVHLGIIAGVILSKAKEMGISIRWGGTFGSKEFNGWDKPHFELIETCQD
ncbi:MAG: hypothetical protein ABJG41_10035 [Cyclobacteriaceae bacterium]